MIDFEPIDNERFAQLAGVHYDCEYSATAPLCYGITHRLRHHFGKMRTLGRIVLIADYSDDSADKEFVDSVPENVQAIFATNADHEHSRLHPIPIGLHYSREREQRLVEHSKAGPLKREKLMYVNFFRDIPRPSKPRVGLYEMFGGLEWVTCKGGGLDNRIPQEEFYLDLRRHDYALSPPGAGPDCHRHWEAMALGCIPVVLRSKATEGLLADMPALLVDDWGEVTKERLGDSLPKLRERFSWPSMRKLDFNYWKEKINHAVDRLRNPA